MDELGRLRHPRVWADEGDFIRMRNESGGNRDYYAYKKQAEELLKLAPPEYFIHPSDAHELWQRDVGDSIANLSFAYRFFEDERYFAAAREWAMKACGYPCFGREEPDLAMGHQLFGLALFYDWCYGRLSDADRKTAMGALAKYGGKMHAAATETGYWKDWNLQNHMWIDVCGLGACAVALYGECEDAGAWLDFSVGRYGDAMKSLGGDGASHEGVGYWGYGVSWLMRFMDIVRKFLGKDMYKGNEWFGRTAGYRLYMSLPRNAQTPSENVFDLADSSRADSFNSSNILYKLANEYGDGHAQWLADEQQDSGVFPSANKWLKIMWQGKSVEKKPYGGLPTLKHFEDMGIVCARADWSGDGSAIVFKCCPALGEDATRLCHRPPYTD
ncbi:MAG: DUF4962 domain-containing protein, partial [Clostridiales bacterium]|nr:DUF4962 domain-containing protein [Clostridiales bacterium]